MESVKALFKSEGVDLDDANDNEKVELSRAELKHIIQDSVEAAISKIEKSDIEEEKKKILKDNRGEKMIFKVSEKRKAGKYPRRLSTGLKGMGFDVTGMNQ